MKLPITSTLSTAVAMHRVLLASPEYCLEASDAENAMTLKAAFRITYAYGGNGTRRILRVILAALKDHHGLLSDQGVPLIRHAAKLSRCQEFSVEQVCQLMQRRVLLLTEQRPGQGVTPDG